MEQWVAPQTPDRSVVSASPIKGSLCFHKHGTLPS